MQSKRTSLRGAILFTVALAFRCAKASGCREGRGPMISNRVATIAEGIRRPRM